MNRIVPGVGLVACPTSLLGGRTECRPSEGDCRNREALGGRVTVDEKSPGKEAISVDFEYPYFPKAGEIQPPFSLVFPQVTDAGLVNLRGLTHLRSLNLKNTKVTDAGLEHLRGLSQLRSVNLSGTAVTDAGLVHLTGLAKLQFLDLSGTQVADAGLVHLQGLPQLQSLNLGPPK